jgi:hypothetical protein
MNAPTRILLFLVGLAAAFGLAFGVGKVVDPDTAPVADHEPSSHGDEHATDTEESPEAGPLRLALSERELAPGEATVSFQIQDAAGDPVTSYDVEHEKELHLIVLGTRDLTDFQHVHPTRAADGTWTADLELAPGTSYRLYADGSTGGAGFLATGEIYTSGSQPAPRPLPEPATRDAVDGFDVELEHGDGEATLRVARDGAPVQLEPYLGALGHLVVIRVDDLEYLHVHPEVGATPVFAVSGLAPGRYRYFFDFQVDGVVRTAAFTVDVGADAGGEHSHDGH